MRPSRAALEKKEDGLAGINQKIAVAAAPTPGKGLALGPDGKIPPQLLVTATGTSFPVTPTDGQEYVYVADATNGVFWRFRWYATGGYWAFVGGPPLYAEVQTDESTTSGTYANLATTGPSITLPFAGDYMVEIGMRTHTDTTTIFGAMSYAIGGTGASNDDWILHREPTAGTGSDTTMSRKRRKAGLTAVTLTAKYLVSGGGGGPSANFSERWMAVTPIKK